MRMMKFVARRQRHFVAASPFHSQATRNARKYHFK
jgi:hypothetical protein